MLLRCIDDRLLLQPVNSMAEEMGINGPGRVCECCEEIQQRDQRDLSNEHFG
jgi:hypothetical protein